MNFIYKINSYLFKRDKSNESAFTLIEILVVFALISLITLFVIPSIGSSLKLSINSSCREIASIVKDTYSAAMVTGQVHRFVFDLKENKFWVESGPESLLLHTAKSLELEESRKRFKMEKEKEEPEKFSLEKTITRSELSLPRGVKFTDVLTEENEKPVFEGKAYTHFFPNGITEQTIVHLEDSSEHKFSLIIFPLMGNVQLVQHYVEREEIQ